MSASGKGKAAALVAAIAMMTGPQVPASATTTTIPAKADAFVLSSTPNANTGNSSSLRIRNDTKISYLLFKVSSLPPGEEVSGATLRVYATSGSTCTLGVEVLRAANATWRESSITWNNQPGAIGSALASAAWTSKGYKTFDVTSAVAAAGPVSFVLRHAPACNVGTDATFQSREAATNEPQLVVETAAAPPAPACSDGADNDSDGLTDFPADPGCTGDADTDETDPPGGTMVVAAAGDIVCSPTHVNFDGSGPGSCQHRATADLLSGANAVLPLGDLQYPDGTLDQFNQAYDPTWGRHAAKTYPVPGNHEYHVTGAQGYFDYWASKGRPTGGAGKGYHSFDLGSWHLIALNTSGGCTVGPPCSEGSPQNNFLEMTLAGTTKDCIAAYWHHPLFNSGAVHGDTAAVKALWDDLYAAGADIVLNGHEHNYQRYAKQDPAGRPASNGIREFIVGTGGSRHYGLLETKDANFEFGNATDFGVLRLQLSANSYSWKFVDVDGAVLDSGGPVPCN